MFRLSILSVFLLITLIPATNGGSVEDEIDVVGLLKRMSELEVRLESVEQKAPEQVQVRQRQSEGYSTTGTTYIRWGRKTCQSKNSQTIYSGHAAGAHYNQGGAGSNHLCLHESPQYEATSQSFHTFIYGVQMETRDVFSTSNHGGQSLFKYPMSCAACYVPTRSAVIMIPARVDCPDGWTKEYQGYVVAEEPITGRLRNQYTCWDKAPEVATGSTSQNQAVIVPAHTACGTLPCSTFVTGSALTCVLCTK